MAAQFQETENSPYPGSHLSFTDLTERLNSLSSVPSLAAVYELVERTKIGDEEVQPYLGFKEGNYSRHRVMKNEFVEMLVLCWHPGQRTPIHDHNGSHGGVKVFEGMLWETTFTFDSSKGLRYKSAREYSPGVVTGSDVPDIHQLGNPDVSDQDLVTLHVYAPPLGVLHTYKPGSAKIDLYTPDDTEA